MIKLIQITFVSITVALVAGHSSVYAVDKHQEKSSITSSIMSNHSDKMITENDFQKRKTKILQHITDRLTKIQQIQTCVQAANDIKAMRACKPHKDKKSHHDEKSQS